MAEYVRVRRPHILATLVLGIILVVAVIVGGLIGYHKLMDSGSDTSSPLVAGKSFEPGATGKVAGTRTHAYLDGALQKVRATDPSKEWHKKFPDAKCTKKNVCTAAAPKALSDAGKDAGGSLVDKLGLKGLAGGSAGALLLLGLLFYAWISEDER